MPWLFGVSGWFLRRSKLRTGRDAPHVLRLSVQGTYRIAVRRNCGHVGQEALARMGDEQIGRWSISRAEHLLAAYCLRSSRRFYQRMYWLHDFAYDRVCKETHSRGKAKQPKQTKSIHVSIEIEITCRIGWSGRLPLFGWCVSSRLVASLRRHSRLLAGCLLRFTTCAGMRPTTVPS